MQDEHFSPDQNGLSLHSILSHWLTRITKTPRTNAALILNTSTKGFALLNLDSVEAIDYHAQHPEIVALTQLTRHDRPLIERIVDNSYTVGALQDQFYNSPPPPRPIPIELLTEEALSAAFQSAIEHIASLEDETTVKAGDMPLKGTLPKVLNYMAIQFTQHQYEILHIAYNMGSHEYELLTPAEKDRMEKLGKWGDRRTVLSCSLPELKKITTTTQLRLEIPSVETTIQKDSQDRQLDSCIDTARVPETDDAQAGGSRDDESITGQKPDTLEPPALSTENSQ